jgi:MFS superfamily sulfate permease-like transporter
VVAVITAVSGLCFGLLVAVLVGVVLTLFLVLRELDRLGVTELQATADLDDVRVSGSHTTPNPGLLILRVDGPLYTANVRSVNRRILAAVDAAHPDTLVLDLSTVGMLPVSVIDELKELGHELEGRRVHLWLAALPPRSLATVRRLPRWVELEAAGHFYPTSLAAARAHQPRATPS